MRRTRDRRLRPRFDPASGWGGGPSAHVAVETLEERFLLAGASPAAALPLIDLGGSDWSFEVSVSQVQLSPPDNAGLSGGDSLSNATAVALAGATLVSGDAPSGLTGDLDSVGSPIVVRVPVSSGVANVQIAFFWTDPGATQASTFQILNNSGGVIYEQRLTGQPISGSLDVPPSAAANAQSFYIQITPDASAPGSVDSAAELPTSFVLLITPVSAATQGSSDAGADESGDLTLGTGPELPAGMPPPSSSPEGPMSAPGPPPRTVEAPSGYPGYAPAAGANGFIALPAGPAVPIGGIFESEIGAVPARVDGTTVDPILADLMPAPVPMPRNNVIAGRSADILTPSPVPSLAAGMRAVSGLAPVTTLMLGPIGRLAAVSDRLMEQADRILALALHASSSSPRPDAEHRMPPVELELADLPELEQPRELRADEQPPVMVAIVEAPAVEPGSRERKSQSRYSVLLGSIYVSSVLIFGLSAPRLSATLKRWRRRPQPRRLAPTRV